MKDPEAPIWQTADAEWLRDCVARLLYRRRRITGAGPASAAPENVALRRALDRAIVDELVLLHTVGLTTQRGRSVRRSERPSIGALSRDPDDGPERETW